MLTIRRNHQQHQVDARRTGQHVAHESLMTRHIYKTEPDAIFFQKSKAEINGNPAPFLFREPVGMRPRQRLHERGFAVIDMAGSSNNYAFPLVGHG